MATREITPEDIAEIAAVVPMTAARHRQPPASATRTVEMVGDHLNAQRFIAEHGEAVRYVPELDRWYIWNGAWWREDHVEAVHGLANDTIDGMRVWVGEAQDRDDFTRRSRHYQESTRSARREGMLAIARPDLAVSVEQLDRHAHLLACRNGTVDLRNGQLVPADREHLITRGVDLEYDASARSDDWEGFLAKIFVGDADLISYVRRLMGYASTGQTSEHVLANFYGQGGNGKSTLISAVRKVLGEHAITAPEGLLVQSKFDQHPERIAVLRGRRLVVSFELEERRTIAEARVNYLTGGDRLTAREMHGRRFDFDPSHTLMLVTNNLPRIPCGSRAIWRRIKVVPFDVTIRDGERIEDYAELLYALHGQAILAWLVEGAVDFYHGGLGTCDAIERATGTYREREDTFAHFLDECTIEATGAKTSVKDLLRVWRSWATDVRVLIGRNQDFVDDLLSRGLEIVKLPDKSRHLTNFVVDRGILAEIDVDQDLRTTAHHSTSNFSEHAVGKTLWLRGAQTCAERPKPQVKSRFLTLTDRRLTMLLSTR